MTSPETSPTTPPSPLPVPGLFSGTETWTPPQPSASPASANDWLPDEPLESPASGSSSALSATDKRALELALSEGYRLLGTGLHGWAATEVEQEFDLYLLDDKDASGLAKPSTNLLVRHGNIPGGADLGDILRILIALAAYIAKQAARRRDARRYLAGATEIPEGQEATA